MNPKINPFIRGYSGLSIQRVVAIHYKDDCSLSYAGPMGMPAQTHWSATPTGGFPLLAAMFR